MPLHVNVGVVPESEGHGFKDNIVDADLDSVLLFIFVEFGSKGGDGIHFYGLCNVVVGNVLFGFGQATGDGLAHACELYIFEGVFVNGWLGLWDFLFCFYLRGFSFARSRLISCRCCGLRCKEVIYILFDDPTCRS